jgi:predicted Zn-dependent protease
MASTLAPSPLAEVENKYVRAALARLRESPDDPDALVVLGVWALSRGHPQKAIEYLNAVTPRAPTYPGIWRLKARAFEALGDAENAERCRQRGADRVS